MSLAIEVAYSPEARSVRCVALTLPEGSTVADALRAAGLADIVASQALEFGVWGRREGATATLRDGDRVEVWRALEVDPKEARRLRYKRQPEHKAKRPAGAGR